MWNVNEQGHGSWTENTNTWWFDARGGACGVSIGYGKSDTPLLQFMPADQEAMPKLADQFVRGNEWHLSFPETEKETNSLRIVLRPLPIEAEGLLIESVVSLQTSLLDTQPTVDIVVPGSKNDTIKEAVVGPHSISDGGCSPISITHGEAHSAALLLASQDYPFTTDCSGPAGLRLRLFGEFLEKGVIRKARVWIRLLPSSGSIDHDELVAIYRELESTPPPLRS